MDKIRKTAFLCTGRAVMFGAFAIVCVMLSFSFDPAMALHAGALLGLVMAEILILKAFFVSWQNPRRTEVWLHLDPDSRPAGDPARSVFAGVLRDVYAGFARHVFTAACWLFAAAMALRTMRVVI